MREPRRRSYATKAEIARVVAAAKAQGITGALEVTADGTIRIIPAAAAAPQTAFDRWQTSRQSR